MMIYFVGGPRDGMLVDEATPNGVEAGFRMRFLCEDPSHGEGCPDEWYQVIDQQRQTDAGPAIVAKYIGAAELPPDSGLD
jgi:hypothetical protein